MRCPDDFGNVRFSIDWCGSWCVCAGKDSDGMVEYDRTQNTSHAQAVWNVWGVQVRNVFTSAHSKVS